MTIHLPFTRLAVFLLALGAVPAFAVERTVTIDAPARVVAGTKVIVNVTASTDADAGEHIGFFHAEYSIDGGRTWIGFSYDQDLGASAVRSVTFPAGPKGSQARIRVLVAFRGGKAGDVDFNGSPIEWNGSWGKWQSPPAKIAVVDVVEL